MNNKTKNRDNSMDLMKGFLALLMICAHVLQFFPLNNMDYYFSIYVNLTTFSGFFFVFGYVIHLAYLVRSYENAIFAKKMLIHFFWTMLAYYISAFSNAILVKDYAVNLKLIIDILTLQIIPGYSEFLLSFAFIYILIFLLKHFLQTAKDSTLLIVATLTLITTFLPYEYISIPILGVLIGSSSFSCFPILQYSSFFFFGVYLARKDKINNITVNFKLIIVFTGFMICLIIYMIVKHNMPSRFPPSFLWVSSAFPFVYAYYLFFKWIDIHMSKNNNGSTISPLIQTAVNPLLHIGSHTLIYLITSNVVIFVAYYLNSSMHFYDSLISNTLFDLGIFIICLLASSAICVAKRAIKSVKQ